MIYLMNDSTPYRRLVGTTTNSDGPDERIPHIACFTLVDGTTVDADPCTFSVSGWEVFTRSFTEGEPIMFLHMGRVRVVNVHQVRMVTFLPVDA